GVAEREERVQRHRETALRLVAAPVEGDLVQLATQLGIDRARRRDAHRIAGLAQPVHRLPHLADRAALKRERRRLDQRLVAVVEGMEAVRAVEAEPPLRGAEDRDPPVAFMRVIDEAADQGVEGGRTPDRVARYDCDTADDAIREKRVAVLGEEERLV